MGNLTQGTQKVRLILERVFKMIGNAVFEEKVGWRGSSSEEQRSQTSFSSKIL